MADLSDLYEKDELREVDAGGEVRKLNPIVLTMADPVTFTMTYEEASREKAPLFPESEWREADIDPFIGPVTDQNGIGMCCAATTVEAMMGSSAFAGCEPPSLSGGDLYRRVSGGVDRGSLPEDCLREAMKGVATTATVPFLEWRRSNASADAERSVNRIEEAYLVRSVQELVSAHMAGFFTNVCMFWYDSDGNTDSEGKLPERPWGRRGGHSITGSGLKKFNGVWHVKIRNHWTARWGVNGCGYIPLSRIANNISSFRMWAVRSVTQRGGNIPAPK